MDAHCGICQEYEEAVMAARDAGREPSADDRPCPEYVMSERFKAWLVESMRAEVLGQVSQAGLDRMAIVRPGDESEE